jgi:hypothetical protein
LKSHPRVAAVTEGLVFGVPAAAKRDQGSPRKSERVARNVFDYNVAADDPKRAVVGDYYRLIVLVAHQLPPRHLTWIVDCSSRSHPIESAYAPDQRAGYPLNKAETTISICELCSNAQSTRTYE